MNALQKLRQLHADITTSRDGLKVVDAWALAGRLLSRMPVDQAEAQRAVKEKDAQALDALIARLENPAPKKEPAPAAEYSKEDLAAAMRAFRKRLKVMRLSDESRLGGRYLSAGKKSSIDAIEPPGDFPPDIWKALVREGQLVDTGRGFYALATEQGG